MSQKIREKYDEDLLLDLYERMQCIRKVEEALNDLTETGHIPGNAHLAIGQEAVAVGSCFPLRKNDFIAGTHRSHHHVVAKGSDVKEVIAEFGGRETGVSGGRGGEMHLFDIENGVLETSGIVGGSVPHLAGTTLSSRLKGEDRVGVAYFGDGGSNQGVILETMNLAAIWDLPVIFLCENNQYAVTTSRDYAVAGDSIADRAAAMGISSKTIDGQDVLGVYETTKEAVSDARDGDGPQFIECKTYRFKGHHNREDALMSDQPYRPDEEVEDWRENRDPIDLFTARLREAGISDGELKSIEDEAAEVVDDAIEFMKQSEHPAAERAEEYMYANQDYPNLPPNKYN